MLEPQHEAIGMETLMPFQAKTKIALAGGAVMVALAAGIGGGVLLSDASAPRPIATPTSSLAPTPPPAAPGAPATGTPSRDFNAPGGGGDTGCIPHANC